MAESRKGASALHRLDPRLYSRISDFIEEFVKGLDLSSAMSFAINNEDCGRGRKAMCAEIRYAGGLAVGGKGFRILFQFQNPDFHVVLTGAMGPITEQDRREINERIEALARFGSWLDLGEKKYESPRAQDERVPPARKLDTFVLPVRRIGVASMVIPAAPRKEAHAIAPPVPRKLRKKRRPGPNNMQLSCFVALLFGEKPFSVGVLAEKLCTTFSLIFTNRVQATATIGNAEKKGYFSPAETWGMKTLTSSGRAVGKRVAVTSQGKT